jgi:hypothetical protein
MELQELNANDKRSYFEGLAIMLISKTTTDYFLSKGEYFKTTSEEIDHSYSFQISEAGAAHYNSIGVITDIWFTIKLRKHNSNKEVHYIFFKDTSQDENDRFKIPADTLVVLTIEEYKTARKVKDTPIAKYNATRCVNDYQVLDTCFNFMTNTEENDIYLIFGDTITISKTH